MIPVLGRYNLPPPVIGGLVFALAAWAAHRRGSTLFTLDFINALIITGFINWLD